MTVEGFRRDTGRSEPKGERVDITKKLRLAFAFWLAIALLAPAAAHAAGTGDDPRRTKDVLTAEEAKAKAADDARFEAWKVGKRAAAESRGTSSKGGRGATAKALTPLLIDAPYTYLYTPSHLQERAYWCGPATCQIITHYWGRLVPQWAFAQYMGTTTAGTDFSKVDDALRYYSFKSYWYVSGIDDWSAFMDQCEYGLGEKRNPMAIVVKIEGDDWPFYEFDHSGHILPIEAFDERITPYKVRVNDPYDEAYYAGGGDTYGHTTYPAYVVQKGVALHWRQAVVR